MGHYSFRGCPFPNWRTVVPLCWKPSWEPTNNISFQTLHQGHQVHSNYQCLNNDLLVRLGVRDQDPRSGETPFVTHDVFLSERRLAERKHFISDVSHTPHRIKSEGQNWRENNIVLFIKSHTQNKKTWSQPLHTMHSENLSKTFLYGLHSIMISERWI